MHWQVVILLSAEKSYRVFNCYVGETMQIAVWHILIQLTIIIMFGSYWEDENFLLKHPF